MKIVKPNVFGWCAFVFLLTLVMLSDKVTASPPSTLSLDDNDKAQIVRSLLHKELTKPKWRRITKVLLLDNGNIKLDWLPSVHNVQFEMLNRAEIKSILAEDKSVSYFFVGAFEAKGQKVRVSFGYCEEGKKSSSGTGLIYEYLRVLGKWRGRAVEGFGYSGDSGQDNE